MASSDPISEKQIEFIDSLAQDVVVDYDGVEALDPLLLPVYGCTLREMNRGQASMVIDTLKWEGGWEGAIEPEWPSFIGGAT